MKQLSMFFPGFNRLGLGRKPTAAASVLTRQTHQLDALCLAQLQVLCGHLLPAWLTCFKTSAGANSRQRVFTPALTFWAWLSQVIDPQSSCRRALCRVQSLCATKGLAAVANDTSAYCRARRRLPARLLLAVFKHLTAAVTRAAGDFGTGGRLLVMDGTTVTLPDSDANRSVYAYAPGQKPGCGFPLMFLLGLFDLRTGAVLRVIKSKSRRHDAALAWRMLGFFRAGDTLIADRAFCSYAFISELQDRGVHVVMRLHQARAKKVDMNQGKSLGNGDCLQQWFKSPAYANKGMHPARHANLRDTLAVRLVEVSVGARGHRPTPMYFVTTLLDATTHSAEAIALLYLRRWDVELFFDDIKTSQSMDMLRCQSPAMVARELLMHLIAYNLVRLLMVQADALRPPGQKGRLSFKGTMDRVNQWQGTLWVSCNPKQAKQRYETLLHDIAKDVVRPRPGRYEPRLIKRRRDNFSMLTKPRHEMRLVPAIPKHQHKAA
jgi:hypothetical protein